MKITEQNYTITTIYFDGQFWCALIEQNRDGKNYAGRFVFGAEPTNPRLLDWMIHEFANIPLLPVEEKSKIRFKKLARNNGKKESGIPKSLVAFSKAQKEYAEERKAQKRKLKKIEKQEQYFAKKARNKGLKGK